MNLIKLFSILTLFLFINACSHRESKLQSILDRKIGKSKFIEKSRLELDSLLGKKNSKLKSSVLEFVSERVEIIYSDILIDGKKARIKVVANIPKMEEMGSLLLLAGFLPREKMLDMTIQEVLAEVSKKTRRPAGQDISSEIYEFTIDFEKGKDWVANSGQLSRAYSKRNLISKR